MEFTHEETYNMFKNNIEVLHFFKIYSNMEGIEEIMTNK